MAYADNESICTINFRKLWRSRLSDKKLLSIKGILIIMDLGSCERHINFKV